MVQKLLILLVSIILGSVAYFITGPNERIWVLFVMLFYITLEDKKQ